MIFLEHTVQKDRKKEVPVIKPPRKQEFKKKELGLKLSMKEQELNVYVVLKNESGKILLLKRHNGIWEFPGGGVEWGESPYDSAKREAEEETGLKVELQGILCITSATFEKNSIQKHAVYIVYKGKGKGEVAVSKEHADFKWISAENMEDYKLGLNVAPIKMFLT